MYVTIKEENGVQKTVKCHAVETSDSLCANPMLRRIILSVHNSAGFPGSAPKSYILSAHSECLSGAMRDLVNVGACEITVHSLARPVEPWRGSLADLPAKARVLVSVSGSLCLFEIGEYIWKDSADGTKTFSFSVSLGSTNNIRISVCGISADSAEKLKKSLFAFGGADFSEYSAKVVSCFGCSSGHRCRPDCGHSGVTGACYCDKNCKTCPFGKIVAG